MENTQSCSTPENICVTGDNGKNNKYEAKNYLESQKYAIAGLRFIIKNERNFRTQLIIAFVAVVLGLLLHISHVDWVALSIVMAVVLIAEAFNSVIEAICDTISQDYRINIKYAKDVSAGAVLVGALTSAIAGVIIFGPYILRLLSSWF